MEKAESKLEIKTILEDLNEPIDGGINLQNLIAKVEKVKFDDKLKRE